MYKNEVSLTPEIVPRMTSEIAASSSTNAISSSTTPPRPISSKNRQATSPPMNDKNPPSTSTTSSSTETSTPTSSSPVSSKTSSEIYQPFTRWRSIFRKQAAFANSIDKYLSDFFYWWGKLVHRYRWLFLFVPVILCVGLSSGLILVNERMIEDTEVMFTPQSSRAITERTTLLNLWPINSTNYMPGKSVKHKYSLELVISAKNGGNLLRDDYLSEVDHLNNIFLHRLIAPSPDFGRINLTFNILCLKFRGECYNNDHVQFLMQRQKYQKYFTTVYPTAGTGESPTYTGNLFGGVQTDSEGTISSVQTIRLLYELYEDSENARNIWNSYSRHFIEIMQGYMEKVYRSDLLNVAFAHSKSMDQGLEETGERFTPNFVTSIILLGLFATLCNFTGVRKWGRASTRQRTTQTSSVQLLCRLFQVDWVESKPLYAMGGLFSAGMAIASSYGFLMTCGMPWNGITNIMPFLILSIGIDDMFLLASAWHRTVDVQVTSSKRRKNTEQTQGSRIVSERCGQALADAAVSITITSVTDALSFAIGGYSQLPGIWIFCSYASAAVIFDYFYQITFFMAIMALLGEAEADRKHCLGFCEMKPANGRHRSSRRHKDGQHRENAKHRHSSLTASVGKPKKIYTIDIMTESCVPSNHGFYQKPQQHGDKRSSSSTVVLDPTNTEIPPLPNQDQEEKSKKVVIDDNSLPLNPSRKSKNPSTATSVNLFFRNYYGPFVLHPASQACAYLVGIVYVAGAIWGCFQVNEGLNPSNIVMKDHHLVKYLDHMEVFFERGLILHVAITKPKNLMYASNRKRLEDFLHDLEHTEYSFGSNSTVFWYRSYLYYLNSLNALIEDTEDLWDFQVNEWLKFTGAKESWKLDMNKDIRGHLTSYRFTTGLQRFVSTKDQRRAAKILRDIADEYEDLGVVVYHYFFPFVDQYELILPNTIRNILIAVICMALVSILLIPSTQCAGLITVSIMSIDLGVFGYMAWWDINLDAISMITIIMSIGFAVDLTTHVSYAYIMACNTQRDLRPQIIIDRQKASIEALENVGWPVLQGGLSTLLGIMILGTVDAYIVETFFRTVFLVIVFGLLHSLYFLPILLTFIDPTK